ncbi:hypothetical protein P5P86_08225 [Nocardioides sp. BP30]|uniref:hypothetical protein n=1 Tax=Nocardioides sp. BP30 TaxID=3036374 RepID=UPI0024699C74|nr:hypothetical protein [Nocardioides sp. BP30]WGL53802.1 hypothetical protein P5P86_08225 [Nocardioides sp. BP30]
MTTDRRSSRVAVRVVVAAVVVLAVALGVLAWRLHGRDTYVVPAGAARSGRPAAEQPGEAAAALNALQRAVRDARPDQVQGTAARTAVANAVALRVQDFTARYVAQDGAVARDGSWSADVAITWRFGGVDASTASTDVSATFAPAGDDGGGRVEVTGFGAGEGRLPLWLAGPVQVRRTEDATVVLAGSGVAAQRRAARYGTLADRAVAAVRKVLPWPHPDLVLEVPSDEAGLERMMGAASGTYHGVAAVTASVDGSASGPVHVLVNPQVIGGLNTQGAQIVLSHEATHAATDVATNQTLPPWLLEGFADYVALRDVTLPLSTTARQIIAEVRTDGAPAHLPGSAEFNDQSESFGAEYEAAWLACRLLARLGGEQALVHLYDDVRGGAGLDATMRRQFGFGLTDFTTQWRRELQGLAR